MSLIEEIKQRIVQAMKNKNEVERDILKLVKGEVQTLETRQNKTLNDEQVSSIVRKLMESNEETIAGHTDSLVIEKLKQENEILDSLLPTVMTQEEILQKLDPISEDIKSVDKEGQAIGMAMKALKSAEMPVLGNDVKEVVLKMRM
tara:strand:- start:51 stop:488 length:438 start_codon:yes stop_codon:yes gene_type:complete